MPQLERASAVAVEAPLTKAPTLHRYSHFMTRAASRTGPWTHTTVCGMPMRNMRWIERPCAPRVPDQARNCPTCWSPMAPTVMALIERLAAKAKP